MIPISLLRLIGVTVGGYFALTAFTKFRSRKIRRADALGRWLVGGGLFIVCLFPQTLNWLRDILALERHAYGRVFALLIASNLMLWMFFFRERSKVFSMSGGFDRLIRGITLAQLSDEDRGRLPRDIGILVVLPAYNEAENLPAVLGRIPEEIGGLAVGVIVIDDGSSDGTADVVREQGRVAVSSLINRGQGAALRLGYDLAIRLEAKIVVTFDADGQHRPEEIEVVVKPVLDDELDFVLGSRLLGKREQDSRFRVAGIHIYNTLINFLARTKVSDCSSGFKAIRVEKLKDVEFREDQFQAAEVIIKVSRAGMRIGEVPITVLRRTGGVSKKGRDLMYGLNFARSIFKAWWS